MPKKELPSQVSIRNFLLLAAAFIAIIVLYFLIVKTETRFTNTFSNLTKKVHTTYNQPPLVTNPSKTKVKISEKDADREVNIDVGQQVELSLQSKTADYKWQLAAPFDASTLKLTDIKYKEANAKVTLSTPTEVWSFQGVKTGKVNVMLTYNSPWDKTSQPEKAETFVISIH